MKQLEAIIIGYDEHGVALKIEVGYSKEKVHLILKGTAICACQRTVSLDIDSARELYNTIAEAQAFCRAKEINEFSVLERRSV